MMTKSFMILLAMITGLSANSATQATVIPLQSWSLESRTITIDPSLYSTVAGGDVNNNFTSAGTAQAVANNLNTNPWVNESCDYYDSATGQLYDIYNPVGSEVYACSRSQVKQYAVEEQTGTDGTPFYIVKRYNNVFVASGSLGDPNCPMTSYCTSSTDLGDSVPQYKNNYTAQNCSGTSVDYFILSDSLCTVSVPPATDSTTPPDDNATPPDTTDTTGTDTSGTATDDTSGTTDTSATDSGTSGTTTDTSGTDTADSASGTGSTTDTSDTSTDDGATPSPDAGAGEGLTPSTGGTQLATEVSIKNPAGGTDGTSPDGFNTKLGEYETTLTGKLQTYLDGYVLLTIPLTASGDCGEMRRDVTLMGHSYSIDCTPYFRQLDGYNSLIKGIIMFMFAMAGIMIVFSGKGD